MMLPITPQPMPTESLPGYLFRLAEANGYPSPAWLWSHASAHPSGYVRSLNANALVELTGMSKERATCLALFDPSHDERNWVNLMGSRVPALMVTTSFTRICSGCVSESNIHEAYFQLDFVNYCGTHRRRLLDRCPECSALLSASRANLGECWCGFELSKFDDGVRCNKLEADLLLVLRRALVGHSGGLLASSAFKHLSQLNLSQLLRLMSVVTSWHRATEQVPRCSAYDPDWFSRLAHIFSNWPINMQAYLQDRYEQPWLLSAHHRFPKLKLLKAAHELESRFVDEIHSVSHIFVQLHSFASRYFGPEKSSRQEIYAGVNPGWVDDHKLSQVTSIDADSVAAIIGPTGGSSRARKFVGAEDVRAYFLPRLAVVSNQGGVLPLRRAAKILDLTVPTIKALRDEGILSRPQAGDLQSLVLLSSVERIIPIVQQLRDFRHSREEGSICYHLAWGRRLPAELLPKFVAEIKARLN
jgi:hypothetical protein